MLRYGAEDAVSGCRHPGYLHFPKGLTKKRISHLHLLTALEKCKEQELLARKSAYQMAGPGSSQLFVDDFHLVLTEIIFTLDLCGIINY